MRRILLDHDLPRGIGDLLPGYEVRTAYEMGWDAVANGNLLTATEQAGFEIFITGDQNIPNQNDLTGRKLAIITLSLTHWPTIRAHPAPLQAAVERAGEGAYQTVTYPRPRRIRRPAPPLP